MTATTPPNIGLIGRKRTGKDTAADHLRETFGYARLGFADPVRAGVAAINPIIAEAHVTASGHTLCGLRYREAIDLYGYERAKDLFPEFRRVLQEFGTGAIREHLGDDVWVDAMSRRLDNWEGGPIVVTDVRFPNEAARLDSLGFVLVRIVRPSVNDGDAHASEALTDTLPAHYEYENEGSIEALHAFMDGVVLTGRPF